MAKSYYILESKKVNGTAERDTSWIVDLTRKNVTEDVASLFYEYLAQEMGTLSYFRVSNEIDAIRNATKVADRKTALGILIGKIGSHDILAGFVDHATKTLNNDLIKDVEDGKDGLSIEEYDQFYAGVKVKPENSHWLYYKAKTYAQETNTELAPYRKSTTTGQVNEEVVDVDTTGVAEQKEGVVQTDTAEQKEGVVQQTGVAAQKGVVQTDTAEQNVAVSKNQRQKPQDRNPAPNAASAKFHPVGEFIARHNSILLTASIFTTIMFLSLTPGTFWATSIFSLLVVNLATWLVSFAVMTATPLRHAKQRSAIRSKIDTDCTKTNSMINSYNNSLATAESSAVKHPNQARNAAQSAKNSLQKAINKLNSALKHQEELYDVIKARRNKFEERGNTKKVQGFDRMPVALRKYIATYIRCEQAVIECNERISELNKQGLNIEAPNFENWSSIKDRTRKYYSGELNAYYQQYNYTRDGQPLRINIDGERIKPIEETIERVDLRAASESDKEVVVNPENKEVVAESAVVTESVVQVNEDILNN